MTFLSTFFSGLVWRYLLTKPIAALKVAAFTLLRNMNSIILIIQIYTSICNEKPLAAFCSIVMFSFSSDFMIIYPTLQCLHVFVCKYVQKISELPFVS